MERKIAVFDFDGTITSKDTLLEFIKYSKGYWKLLGTFILFSPILIGYKLNIYPNWKAKQKIFSFLFKGMKISYFHELCIKFFNKKGESLLRSDAIDKINELKRQGYELVIVSASIDCWIKPFANHLGISTVLATEIELDYNECLTGFFCQTNCFGKEKVKRILENFPERETYELIAFGDSKGDKEMLAFADAGYYRIFRM